MGKVDLSPLLHDVLTLFRQFASRITVSKTSICSSSILAEMPEFCDCSFTVKTKDFVAMLKQTREFDVNDTELRYRYRIGAGAGMVKVERSIRAYDEVYQVAGGIPLLSIAVPSFRVLSQDDCEVRADKDGNLVLESSGVVKTRSEYVGLRVPDHTVDSVAGIRVRGRDLRILEELKGEVVLSFLDSHILGYSLGSNFTVVVQIGILST